MNVSGAVRGCYSLSDDLFCRDLEAKIRGQIPSKLQFKLRVTILDSHRSILSIGEALKIELNIEKGRFESLLDRCEGVFKRKEIEYRTLTNGFLALAGHRTNVWSPGLETQFRDELTKAYSLGLDIQSYIPRYDKARIELSKEIEQAETSDTLEIINDKVNEHYPHDLDLVNALRAKQSVVSKKERLEHARQMMFLEIAQASTSEMLDHIKEQLDERFPLDEGLKKALTDKLTELINNQNEAKRQYQYQYQFSTFIYDPKMTDEIYEQKMKGHVIQQIPPKTYTEVKVTTLANYLFIRGRKKARKIELIRTEWGLIKLPILEGIGAGLSAAIKKDSIYREENDKNMVLAGLGLKPASDLVSDDEETNSFYRQINAAYWCGKKIEIIYPADHSPDGRVRFYSESKILEFSIDIGKFLRSLFTSK